MEKLDKEIGKRIAEILCQAWNLLDASLFEVNTK